MRIRGLGLYAKIVLPAAVVAIFGANSVMGLTSSSDNYLMTETKFGSGSSMESCSGEYCAQSSMGGLASGEGQSSNYSAQFGAITSSDPLLEVIVDAGQSDLGVFRTDRATTKTIDVKVRNYLSQGYTLSLMGQPPQYDGHVLEASTSPQQSQPGTEQFGVNAVANTTPEVGADPLQLPSGQTSFGVVAEGYDTPDRFMYSSGDVIARSDSESGRTDYTISLVVNVSNSTPSGQYASDFSALVIPVY